MFTKRITITFLLGLLTMSSAFAGKEDWYGTYNINDGSGTTHSVQHTPTGVSYLFMSAGKGIQLRKGCTINDIVIKEDVNLYTDSNVTTFKGEVLKLGKILSESVKLGPTYQE